MKKKKRLISGILALSVVLSMNAFPVYAENDGGYYSESLPEIPDLPELPDPGQNDDADIIVSLSEDESAALMRELNDAPVFETSAGLDALDGIEVDDDDNILGRCGTNLSWKLDTNGTFTVTGTGAMTNYDSTNLPQWSKFRDRIKKVIISEGVTSVGKFAFYNCMNLTSVQLPESVTALNVQSFYNCSKLASVDLPKNLKAIGSAAFLNCTSLKAVNASPDSAEFATVDGVLFSKDLSRLIVFPNGLSGEYTVPEGVTAIDTYSFAGAKLLTKVTIPEGVKEIGSFAFAYCGKLTGITVPASADTLIDNPFVACLKLTDISVSENNGSYTSADGVLYNKNKTELVACPAGKSGEFKVPEGVVSLGVYSFYNCSYITSLNIPVSVEIIEANAFRYLKAMTDIHYGGTVEQWSEIFIKSTNDFSTCVIRCTDGNIGEKIVEPDYAVGTEKYPTLKSVFDDINKAVKENKNKDSYTIRLDKAITEKSVTLPKADISVELTGETLTANTIAANCDLTVGCGLAPYSNAVNITAAKDRTITINKDCKLGTLSGGNNSKLYINGYVTADTVKTFTELTTGDDGALYICKAMSGVTVGSAELLYSEKIAGKIKISGITDSLYIKLDENIESGTTVLTYEGSGEFPQNKVFILNTDNGDRLQAFAYKKEVRAEIPGLFKVNDIGCSSWESALKQMNDPNKDYTVYISKDATVEKFSLPTKAKSLTLSGNGCFLKLPKTKTFTLKYPLTLNAVFIFSGNDSVNINAGKYDLTMKHAVANSVKSKGKLILEETVYIYDDVSVGELSIPKANTSLRCSSLSVTSKGITSGSLPLRLGIYGNDYKLKPLSVGDVLGNTFKPSYTPGSIYLEPECGRGDIVYENGKLKVSSHITLYGKPWITSNIIGNLPSSRPEAKDDVYTYYNYDYIKAHQDKTSSTVEDAESEFNETVLSVIDDETITGHDIEQLRIFYDQITDTKTLAENGMSEIQPYIDKIDAVKTTAELNSLITSEDYPFNACVGSIVRRYDKKTTNEVTLYPEFIYFDPIENYDAYGDCNSDYNITKLRNNLAEDISWIVKDLAATGMSESDAEEAEKKVFSLEMTYGSEYANMNDDAYYVQVTSDELFSLCKNIPIKALLAKNGRDGSDKYYMYSNKEWLPVLDKVWTDENLELIKNTVKAQLLAEVRDYHDQLMYIDDQEKRDDYDPAAMAYYVCNKYVTFSHMFGKIYVDHAIGDEGVKRIRKLTDDIIQSFNELIKNTKWMSDTSKEKVLKKINNLSLCLLQPVNGYRDYSNVDLIPASQGGTLLGNYLRLKKDVILNDNKEIGGSKELSYLWRKTTPSELNCFYYYCDNSVNLMAGWVTSLMYRDGMSDSELLGTLGTTIGHEIGHSIDLNCFVYNELFEYDPVYTDDDFAEYTALNKQLMEFYDVIEPMPGRFINGELVIGETMAEYVGLCTTLNILGKDPNADYDLYFKSYINYMCSVFDEGEFDYRMSNEHPINCMWVNTTIRMFEEIYTLFGIKEGDGMYLAPEDRLYVFGPNAPAKVAADEAPALDLDTLLDSETDYDLPTPSDIEVFSQTDDIPHIIDLPLAA